MSDEYVDKLAIVEVVQLERSARDQGRWDVMLDAYFPESYVRIAWFAGTGPEFVESSRRSSETGHAVVHMVGPTLVRLDGDRSLADTGCSVNAVRNLDGVEVDFISMLRLRSRLERSEGRWRLRSLRAVFGRDKVSVRSPASQLRIDEVELQGYRQSYQWLSYTKAHSGGTPDQGLPGFDRMETVDQLVRDDEAWLALEA